MILSSLNFLFSLFKYDLCVVELSRLAAVGVVFKRHKKGGITSAFFLICKLMIKRT